MSPIKISAAFFTSKQKLNSCKNTSTQFRSTKKSTKKVFIYNSAPIKTKHFRSIYTFLRRFINKISELCSFCESFINTKFLCIFRFQRFQTKNIFVIGFVYFCPPFKKASKKEEYKAKNSPKKDKKTNAKNKKKMLRNSLKKASKKASKNPPKKAKKYTILSPHFKEKKRAKTHAKKQ